MRRFLVAFVLLSVACVSAHPAEYASKHWGCPEARIKITDAHAQGSARAYEATGCGKKMIVECVYSDDNPDTPYECTSRDETEIGAAPAIASAPKASPKEPPAPVAIATAAPLPAPATMIAPPARTPAGAHFVATDGRSFSFSDRDSKTAALAASGAFDLACAPAGVTASILYTADLGKPVYIAEGCGQRASYVLVRRTGSTPEVDVVLLTSIVSVKSPSPAP